MRPICIRSRNYILSLILILSGSINLKSAAQNNSVSQQGPPWSEISAYKSFNACYIAAQKGNIKAQIELGESYQKGIGIPKDDDKSIYWYKKAAMRGSSAALLQLAFAHAFGKGVEINLPLVYLYSEMAINNYSKKERERGEDFPARGLNLTTRREISDSIVLKSRLFSILWKPGMELPGEDYFDTISADRMEPVIPKQSGVDNSNEPYSIAEYKINQFVPLESLSNYTFSMEGNNGWELIAIVEKLMPAIPGMPTPSMVDTVFMRKSRNVNLQNYVRWEYNVVNTMSFNINDPMFQLNNGWEIATVFLGKNHLPGMITSSFKVILKRKLN